MYLSNDLASGSEISSCNKFDKPLVVFDLASGSEVTPCNKFDKPQVVYRFSGNVMTSIATLCT